VTAEKYVKDRVNIPRPFFEAGIGSLRKCGIAKLVLGRSHEGAGAHNEKQVVNRVS
jgi:hypothetical protein